MGSYYLAISAVTRLPVACSLLCFRKPCFTYKAMDSDRRGKEEEEERGMSFNALEDLNFNSLSKDKQMVPVTIEDDRSRGNSKDGIGVKILLLLVPALWGTYEPAIRYIYDQPNALHPSVLILARKVLALAFSFVFLPMENLLIKTLDNPIPKEETTNHKIPAACIAPLELGLWVFLGTAFQATGLETTTATRSAFLLQTVNVMVPLLSTLLGGEVAVTTWLATTIALFGVGIIIASGNGQQDVNMLQNLSKLTFDGSRFGDFQILVASVFYALYTVRLSSASLGVQPIRLTAGVMATSTLLSALWAVLELRNEDFERELLAAYNTLQNENILAAVAFSAFFPGTLASIIQTIGQRSISAAEAQVIFSLQPLFSSILAYMLLGEKMTYWGWIGGCIVALACIFASLERKNKELH